MKHHKQEGYQATSRYMQMTDDEHDDQHMRRIKKGTTKRPGRGQREADFAKMANKRADNPKHYEDLH